MPSFDVVSELDRHELENAIDQTRREVETRFDFKNVKTTIELNKEDIKIATPEEFQTQQLKDILIGKLAKRKIDSRVLDEQKMDKNLSQATIVFKLKAGLDKESSKKVVAMIKDGKLKVQAAIQGDVVRVTGKSRDDLQETIALLRKKEEDLAQPLQYKNFRD
jgi:uncharacterized protein YajQ (UPF0234 family)